MTVTSIAPSMGAGGADGAGQAVVGHDGEPLGLRLGQDGVGGDERDGRGGRRGP